MMPSLDQLARQGLGHAWMLLLSLTAALLLVGLLRKYSRRAFGAERAFLLWLLPPVAMLASQLPHAGGTEINVMPPVVQHIASMANALSAHAVDPVDAGDYAWGMLIWIAGGVLVFARAMFFQHRYHARLRDATVLAELSSRWLVVRAKHVDVGPALLGAWRPRIVLPADFDHRYNAVERALILAHESMHARRYDGWWNLCAQLVLAAFWFHPLAWLGWNAFRHDQELACDAAVMHEHGSQRRSYANAMLKTQFMPLQLPIGCSWSPTHPITERIAMLTTQIPNRRRQFAGLLFVLSGTLLMAGFAYAASQDASAATPGSRSSSGYQLDLIASRGHDVLTHSTVCTSGAQQTTILQGGPDSNDAWQFTFAAKPAGDDQVQVDVNGSVSHSGSHTILEPTIFRGLLGRTMLLSVDEANTKDSAFELSITPSAGCSAAEAAKRSAKVDKPVPDAQDRSVAQSTATRSASVLN